MEAKIKESLVFEFKPSIRMGALIHEETTVERSISFNFNSHSQVFSYSNSVIFIDINFEEISHMSTDAFGIFFCHVIYRKIVDLDPKAYYGKIQIMGEGSWDPKFKNKVLSIYIPGARRDCVLQVIL
jgi:hypothetical protein